VLSIAGYDPSSGAGVTADVKTAAAHGCFAATCITALTVQSTRGVLRVEPVNAETVRQTLDELAKDFSIAAVRIGMLATGAIAGVVADFLSRTHLPNVVLDPIIVSSSGAALVDDAGLRVIRERLIPASAVVTPNAAEAAALTGIDVLDRESQVRAARALLRMGARAAVVTGGHFEEAADLLAWSDGERAFVAPKIQSKSTHGTGCAFATSIACSLALGSDTAEAVEFAKSYVRGAIAAAQPMGHGTGPMEHLWNLR